MKIYNSPMLQVVSIKNNDILTQSVSLLGSSQNNDAALDAGRRFDEWEEGF